MADRSESIKEIATALAKAQAKIQHASKDSTNPHFNSKYADLASVLDACREPLSENSLSVIQSPQRIEGAWILVTRLMHTSGEWLEGYCPILSTKTDAQGFGSGLTYARRYGLSAMVGVAQDDDDGNAASSSKGNQNQNRSQNKQQNQQQKPADKKPEQKPVNNMAPVSQDQIKRLFAIAGDKKVPDESLREILKGLYKLESTKDLKTFQYDELCKLIQTKSLDEIGHLIVERQADEHMQKGETP